MTVSNSQLHFEFCGAIRVLLCLSGLVIGLIAQPSTAAEPGAVAEPGAGQKSEAKLETALSNHLLILNVRVSQRAPSVALFSERGDVHFFLGRFSKAVADYQKMIEIDPQQGAGHWRLGLALFYEGNYEAAADQFDRCGRLDQVDRENGIWRYFSQWKALGKAEARKQLIKYETMDREPFGKIYQLFSGELSPQQILDQIQSSPLEDAERQKQLFYANLYLGLNCVLESDMEQGRRYLQAAVESPWPQQAGYGSNYMWHLGRLQLNLLPAIQK